MDLTFLEKKTYTYTSNTGGSCEIEFISDRLCRGWVPSTYGSYAHTSPRRIKIYWNDRTHEMDVLDFSFDFRSFTGLNIKFGRCRGILKSSSAVPIPKPDKKRLKILSEFDDCGDVKKTIEFVVPAYSISERRIKEYINWNSSCFVNSGCHVSIISDKTFDTHASWVDIIVYPYKLDIIAASKLCNFGVRRINQVDCLIARSDIDIVYTRKIFKYLRETVSYNAGALCICGRINPKFDRLNIITSWPMLPKFDGGFGACLCFTKRDWYRLNGYNENMVGYGYEDTDIVVRAERIMKVHSTKNIPIFHVSHPIRRGKNKQFPNNITKNQNMIGKVWENDDWGL